MEARSVMTVEEVAEYLQVSDRTIYNMATDGQIPAAKIAGKWRFPKSEVDAWLGELARVNVRTSYLGDDDDE